MGYRLSSRLRSSMLVSQLPRHLPRTKLRPMRLQHLVCSLSHNLLHTTWRQASKISYSTSQSRPPGLRPYKDFLRPATYGLPWPTFEQHPAAKRMSLLVETKRPRNAIEPFLAMAVLRIGHKSHVGMRFGPHRLAALPQPGMCQPPLTHCHRRRQPASSGRISSERISANAAAQLSAADGANSQHSYSLSLRTADPEKARGLVHRCLVTEAQNVRRVSSPALGLQDTYTVSCQRSNLGFWAWQHNMG